MAYYYISSILWIWISAFHPIYISLTEIRYISVEQRIEMAQKVFWKDLEVALSEENKAKINFLNPKDLKELDKMIGAYALEMNEIHINGEKIVLTYLGHEIEEDTVWLYLEGNSYASPQSVKVRNAMLIRQFDTQQNIVNFYKGESPISLVTFKDKEWEEIKLN